MREIKFRAWNKKRKKMYEVLHLHTETLSNGGLWATVKGRDIIDDKDIHIQIQPKDIVVMQYTGLQDRNGNESYHKDIIDHEGSIYVVEWDEKDSGFYLAYYRHLNDPESEEHIIGSCIREGTVIGNLYENPGLLEQGLPQATVRQHNPSEAGAVEGGKTP